MFSNKQNILVYIKTKTCPRMNDKNISNVLHGYTCNVVVSVYVIGTIYYGSLEFHDGC